MSDVSQGKMLELIDRMARVETKIDSFLVASRESQIDTKRELTALRKDVDELKTRWRMATTVISLISAAISSGLVFFGGYLKSKLGLGS